MPARDMQIAYGSQIKFYGAAVTFSRQFRGKIDEGILVGCKDIPFTTNQFIYETKLKLLWVLLPGYAREHQ